MSTRKGDMGVHDADSSVTVAAYSVRDFVSVRFSGGFQEHLLICQGRFMIERIVEKFSTVFERSILSKLSVES